MIPTFSFKSKSTNSDDVFTHVTHVIRNQNGVDITLIPVILYFLHYSGRFVGKERSK